MSKKTSTIKITEENYEGYAKLYNERIAADTGIRFIKLQGVGLIMLSAGIYFFEKIVPPSIIDGTTKSYIDFLAVSAYFANCYGRFKLTRPQLPHKKKVKLKIEYPNINVKLTFSKLEKVLKEEYMIVDGYAKAENYKMNQIAEKAKKEIYQTSIDRIKNTNFSFRDYKQDCDRKTKYYSKYLIKKIEKRNH